MNGQTSYADWLRNNRGTVDQVAARVAPPAAAPAPAPAPAQPAPAATPAPVTIQVNAGAAQPATPAPPAAQMKPPEASPQPTPEQPAEPAPAPAPEPAPEPPPVEAVSMPGNGNLRTQQAGIQAARIADQNAIGQSFIRQGDATAAGEARNAEAIGAVNEKAAPLAEAAQTNAQENAAQSDKYKRYMDEDIEALRKPIIDDRSGLEKAGGILAGIVGAMFQGRGVIGNALSYGMGALESHINKSLEDQLNAKDSAGKSLPHVQKAMDQLAKDSSDQTEIAAKLMANQYLMAENQLKKIAAETKVPEIKENAYRLAMGAHGEALKQAENIVEARLKAAAHNPKTDWSKFPLQTLEAWEASGKLPGAGVQYLDSVRSGKLGNEAKAAETRAANAKAAGEAGGAQQEVLPGYVATIPLEKKDVSDIRTNRTALNSIQKDFQELKAIRARNKGKPISDPNDVAYAKNIISRMTGTMNQFAGRGAPSNAELEDMKANLLDPTDSYVRTDPTVVYDQMLRGLQSSFDAGLDSLGVKRAGGEPPPPRAEEVVMVRAPASAGGGVRPVARSKLQMALQAGGTLVSEETRQPAQAAMADASNADYEEQVRKEQGYR